MKRLICFSILLLCFLIFITNTQASDKGIKNRTSSATTNNSAKLNLNNLSTWIYNNGSTDVNPKLNSGLEYPRGSGKTVVYESGLVWGAKIDGQIRVGGSTYYHGLQRGKILSSGTPDDTNLVKNRIYRVRQDYKTADFSIEAAEEGKTEQEIFAQYEKDWNEWPAVDDAPFQDINGDGKYDPNIDIPGIKDALQTIWYIANDLNVSLTQKLYGSQPMGIEIQATFWTYNRDFYLNNTYFRKYKLINKSSNTFSDMYINMWVDPDVGDASDDLVGCDTTMNLGFAYNANPIDAVYGQIKPPAVSFDLLQGPVVKGIAGKDLNKNGIDDAQDYAIFNGMKTVEGYINLPMTAFSFFAMSDPASTDPILGSYEGTYQMYNFMQGKVGKTGEYFKDLQGHQTTFEVSGDPYKGTGWLDGISVPVGDRRFNVSSGPFNMAVGDTQEVVFSEMAIIGYDRLHSVGLLKEYDKKIKQYYKDSFNFKNIATPEAPIVHASYTTKGISLDWAEDSQIENFSFEMNNDMRTCYLRDATLNKYLTRDLSTYTSRDLVDYAPIIDGVKIVVQDAVSGMKDFQIPAGELKWSPVYGNTMGLEGFSGAIGNAYDNWFSSSTVQPGSLFNTLIKFASTDSLGNLLDPNDLNASFAYRYVRGAATAPAKPEFKQYIKNPSTGYAYQDYTKSLPFAAFNAVTGQRLMVGYLENNAVNGRVDGKYWPQASEEGIDNFSTTGPREWFFIFNERYDTNPSADLMVNLMSTETPMLWFGTPTRKGATSTVFSNQDQFMIIKGNLFTTNDKFTFKTNSLTSVQKENAPIKFELSQNYPNPFNPKTQIQFSLKDRGIVTLKVYNVLGQMVQELINKELNSGVHKIEFNGDNLASGIYIYRLDVKDKFSEVKKMVLLK